MTESAGTLPDTGLTPETVLIAMNRFNLIPVISSGLVRPASTYGKYYEDVLGLRPHLIPLFTQPPGQEVMELCASEGRQAFPVLLELPLTAVTEEEREAGATSRPIPTSGGLRLYCRSAADARELTAHTWQNADLTALNVTVSHAAFEGTAPSLEDLTARLARLPGADDALPARLSAAARLTGGLLAVASQGAEEHRFIASLFQGEQPDGGWPESAGFRLIRQTLQGRAAITSEERLLWVMTRVLVRLQAGDRMSAEQLLKAYRRQLEEDFPDEVTGLKTIDRADRILVHPDVRPGDDRDRPVSFALLIHILRQQLSELVPDRPDWAAFFEAGRPTPDTLMIARFLTGMRISRERLDTLERPAGLNDLAATLESEAALDPDHSLLAVLRGPVEVRAAEDQAGTGTGEAPAAALTGEPHVPDAPQATAADDFAGVSAESPRAVRADQEPAAVPASTDVGLSDVSICLLRGWTDLLVTQVQLTGPVQMQLVPGRGANNTLLLPHDVQVSRVVIQPEEYARRLLAQPLSDAEQEQLQAAAGTAPPARKRTRTAAAKSGRKRGKAAATPPGDGEPSG